MKVAPAPVVPLADRARAIAAASDDDGPVPSPCVCVCTMNAQTGLCDGCLRNIQEIAAWSALPDDGKRKVWALIAERSDAGFKTRRRVS